jgi:hypothetical protein
MNKVVSFFFLLLFNIGGWSANFFVQNQSTPPWLKTFVPYEQPFIPIPPVTLAENLAYAEIYPRKLYEQEQCIEPDSNLRYFHPNYSKPYLSQEHDSSDGYFLDNDAKFEAAKQQLYGELSETEERVWTETLNKNGRLSKFTKREGGHKRFPKKKTDILNAWLYANLDSPYPTEQEKMQLAKESGLDHQQVANWFTNARRRNQDLSRTGFRK